MGLGSIHKSMISRKCWVLALWLSSTLDEPEREAVIGDLKECAESGGRALASVLGLVVRRQTAIWKDSHFWIVLLILVLPLSFLLCTIAQNAAGLSAVYTWMYANNWDWALTKNIGFWYVLAGAAVHLFLDWLTVVCWSWSAGFLLGCLRNAVQPTARVAFLLLLAVLQIAHVPERWFHLWLELSGVPPFPSVDPNAPVTAIAFYRVIFPFLMLVALVALPAISGMRQPGLNASRKVRVALLFGASVSVMTMLFRVPPGFGLVLGASGRQWVWQHRAVMGLMPLIGYWPVLYAIAVGMRHLWGRRPATT